MIGNKPLFFLLFIIILPKKILPLMEKTILFKKGVSGFFRQQKTNGYSDCAFACRAFSFSIQSPVSRIHHTTNCSTNLFDAADDNHPMNNGHIIRINDDYQQSTKKKRRLNDDILFQDFYTKQWLPKSLRSKEHLIPISVFRKNNMHKKRNQFDNVQEVQLSLNQFRRNYRYADFLSHCSLFDFDMNDIEYTQQKFVLSSPSSFLSIHKLRLEKGIEPFFIDKNKIGAFRCRSLQLFFPLFSQQQLCYHLQMLLSRHKNQVNPLDIVENHAVFREWEKK